MPESPTQKEVWNLSSCPQPAPYRAPAPALVHNLQKRHCLPPRSFLPPHSSLPRFSSRDKGDRAAGAGGRVWPGSRRQWIFTVSRCPPSGLLAGLPWQADSAVCWRGCLRLPCSGWRGSGWQQLPLRGCLRRADRGCESWHGRGSVCRCPHSAAG